MRQVYTSDCAVICGADNWVAIEEFGNAKEDWFTELLELEHGISSHDTLGKSLQQLIVSSLANVLQTG